MASIKMTLTSVARDFFLLPYFNNNSGQTWLVAVLVDAKAVLLELG